MSSYLLSFWFLIFRIIFYFVIFILVDIHFFIKLPIIVFLIYFFHFQDLKEIFYSYYHKIVKKDGVFITKYSNGMVGQVWNYKNGKLDGVQKFFYITGEILQEENFNNNQYDGSITTYFKNGQISDRYETKDNNLVGNYEIFTSYGDKFCIIKFQKNIIREINYFTKKISTIDNNYQNWNDEENSMLNNYFIYVNKIVKIVNGRFFLDEDDDLLCKDLSIHTKLDRRNGHDNYFYEDPYEDPCISLDLSKKVIYTEYYDKNGKLIKPSKP